ncbi:MAG: VanW family protein [Actinomycetota bacterium]|nr:VanW family protein [Actinomycetota bacterium]
MSGISTRLNRLALGTAAVAALIVALPATAGAADAAELPPGGSFVDDNNSVHEGSIEALAAAGITVGCNPPTNDRFCPSHAVTRAEMATFIVRGIDLGEASVTPFSDTAGSVHEPAINTIAAAGITRGCNPPLNDEFCPDKPISRGEMASMLARAFGLTAAPVGSFTDLGESVHSADINAIAAAGITQGCNPPANDEFCPYSLITREEMASMLARAIGLEPIEPPDAPFHLISSFTTHHSCCQTRVQYVQEVADKIDGIVMLPGDTLSMLKVLGNDVDSGNCQTSTTLFNAVWYAGLNEIEHRPHSVDFARYPQAIESTLIPGWVDLRFSNDTAHPLEIRAHYTGTSVTVELWGDNDGRSVVGDFTSTAGTVLDVVSEGGANARVVGTKTVANGRTYTVTRTITDAAGSASESWSWTYRY